MQGNSVKEIFNHAFAEKKDVALLAFTGWAVWNRRNQIQGECLPIRSDLVISKGKEKGVPKSSSSNSEDAAPKTHQMEATE